VCRALAEGISVDEIHQLSRIDPVLPVRNRKRGEARARILVQRARPFQQR